MDWLRLSSISGSHWSGSSSNQNFATLKFDRLLGRARRAMAGVFFPHQRDYRRHSQVANARDRSQWIERRCIQKHVI